MIVDFMKNNFPYLQHHLVYAERGAGFYGRYGFHEDNFHRKFYPTDFIQKVIKSSRGLTSDNEESDSDPESESDSKQLISELNYLQDLYDISG